GLLSSVGESRWCLQPKVKKIPLTVDCVNYSYDITEPQPQLFVTPDFKTLVKVLDELANRMAFRHGGVEGLRKAIKAQTVNTVQLNSGIQISGQLREFLSDDLGNPAYLIFHGPTQLSFADKQLAGHGTDYHAHGFGTPVGRLARFPEKCPSELSESEFSSLGIHFSAEKASGDQVTLEFASGLKVIGTPVSRLVREGRTILLSLQKASATFRGRVLFEPSWGQFDMALGSSIPSVFGGAADREAFGEIDDFVAKRVPKPKYSALELERHKLYQKVRDLRENGVKGDNLKKAIEEVLESLQEKFPEDWLLRLELYELSISRLGQIPLTKLLWDELMLISRRDPKSADVIRDGISLAEQI
ncbi:MAG: phenylalanine 4-monooxygenase, partial [Bdellovibrionaceae bacterium]|nr:phenylalanine 4-monooxygenase [Pseudobdellovibrionaceae bacterium]